jgi:hypothetical protein
MSGAIPPRFNISSWCGAWLSTGTTLLLPPEQRSGRALGYGLDDWGFEYR